MIIYDLTVLGVDTLLSLLDGSSAVGLLMVGHEFEVEH